jgi:3-(3-hydroxy-phenyl)propionate hydroxylase
MAPPSRGFRLLRDAVLSLSLTQEFVRPLYHWRTSRPHEYSHSELNSDFNHEGTFKDGLALGAPPQNVQFEQDNFLLDHLGGGFDLVYLTHNGNMPPQVLAATELAKQQGVPLKLIAIKPQNSTVQGADISLFDPQNRFGTRYGIEAGGAYLFRPDQHICARWAQLNAEQLMQSLKKALMQ